MPPGDPLPAVQLWLICGPILAAVDGDWLAIEQRKQITQSWGGPVVIYAQQFATHCAAMEFVGCDGFYADSQNRLALRNTEKLLRN